MLEPLSRELEDRWGQPDSQSESGVPRRNGDLANARNSKDIRAPPRGVEGLGATACPARSANATRTHSRIMRLVAEVELEPAESFRKAVGRRPHLKTQNIDGSVEGTEVTCGAALVPALHADERAGERSLARQHGVARPDKPALLGCQIQARRLHTKGPTTTGARRRWPRSAASSARNASTLSSAGPRSSLTRH